MLVHLAQLGVGRLEHRRHHAVEVEAGLRLPAQQGVDLVAHDAFGARRVDQTLTTAHALLGDEPRRFGVLADQLDRVGALLRRRVGVERQARQHGLGDVALDGGAHVLVGVAVGAAIAIAERLDAGLEAELARQDELRLVRSAGIGGGPAHDHAIELHRPRAACGGRRPGCCRSRCAERAHRCQHRDSGDGGQDVVRPGSHAQNLDTSSSFAPSNEGYTRQLPPTQRKAARRSPTNRRTVSNSWSHTVSFDFERYWIEPLK